MNALILSGKRDFYVKYSGTIHKVCGGDVYNVPRIEDAENLVFSDQHFSFIIIDADADLSILGEFVMRLKNSSNSMPILFVCPSKKLHEVVSAIKYNPLYTFVPDHTDESVVMQNIDKIVRMIERRDHTVQDEVKFHKLPISLFLNLHELPFDVYLELPGRLRKVKIFSSGHLITPDDFYRYEEKGVTSLYLMEKDYLKFTHLFLKENTRTASSSLKTSVLAEMGVRMHENLHHFCNNIGIRQEVVEMVNISIDLLGKTLLKKSPILDVLKGNLKQESYLSEHSMMVALLLASMIRKVPGMASKENYMKMSLAALFHDISLEGDLWYNQTLNDLTSKQKKVYYDHPQKSVEMLKKIDGLPPDVEKIIIQHHEKPDGTGFPHGLDHTRIFIFAAFFIVAEDLIHSSYKEEFNSTAIRKIMSRMATTYTKGHFKDAFTALESVVFESEKDLLGAS